MELEYIDDNKQYENYKKDIVTKIAYLIGVKDSIIKTNRFEQNIISSLEENDTAKIIRALAILRSEFIRNFKEISSRNMNLEPLETLTDLISVDLIKYLRNKGIEIIHVNANLTSHIAYVNQIILEKIDLIKDLIPSWIKWEYVKSIFLMPGCYAGFNGSNISNTKQNQKITLAINRTRIKLATYSSFYPYRTYLNWPENKIKPYYGNILLNDEKFLKILYASFDETFHANEYVIDATSEDKNSIYDFVEKSINIAILVDCENVDPYRFASVFKNLNEENLEKIKKVILYDDVNTSNAWDYINDYIKLPIEHKEIQRVLNNKSLVDIAMTSGACKEYYQENTESLILASSDSDFYGLISSLAGARFYVLNESDKTSDLILDKLDEANINYCFMDSFAQGEVQDFKNNVLLRNLQSKLNDFNQTKNFVTLNPKELVDIIFQECHIQGSPYQLEAEKKVFFDKYIKKGFKISIVGEGDEQRFMMELASVK